MELARTVFRIFAVVLCFGAIATRGKEIHVPAEFSEIQAAILSESTVDGDTIVLAQGVHAGPGNRDVNYQGKLITIRSTNPADPLVVAGTVISAGGSVDEEHRGVIFQSGEGPGAVLEGVTVSGAYANSGAGIACLGSSPTIRNCVIMGNTTIGRGGGIYCQDSTATIISCTIIENVALNIDGGGIGCVGGSPLIEDCLIISNQTNAVLSRGGGIYIDQSDPLIRACVVEGNRSGFGGGLLAFGQSNPVLQNCLIVGNLATSSGGGLYSQESLVTVLHCTVSDNRAEVFGGGFRGFNGGRAVVTNSILWGNQAQLEGDQVRLTETAEMTVSYSDVEGGQEGISVELGTPLEEVLIWGVGNIDADAQFEMEGSWASQGTTGTFVDDVWNGIGDFHLTANSPCRNAGEVAAAVLLVADLDGQPRWIGSSVDMGAYEMDVPDGPDLVGVFAEIKLAEPVVPGDKTTLPLLITNIGNEFAEAVISIALYASSDAVLDEATDVLIVDVLNQKVKLAVGDSKVYKLKMVAPHNLGAGSYHLLAKLDADNVLTEGDESNLSNVVVSDQAYAVVWQFGNVPGRKNVKLTVLDPGGKLVTFKLGGLGLGEVSSDFSLVELQETTLGTTLAIAPSDKEAGTAVGQITVLETGSLKGIMGKNVDLVGGGIMVPKGIVGKVTLRDVVQSTIDLGPVPGGKSAVSFQFRRVADASILSNTPIKSLSVLEWLRGADVTGNVIDTVWLGKLSSKGDAKANPVMAGDFEANLQLSGDAAVKAALSSARVSGSVRGVVWDIHGPVGSLAVGAVDGTWIFVGVAETIMDKDGFTGSESDFDGNGFALKSLSVAGVGGDFFVNESVLAAWQIGGIKFSEPSAGSGLVEFFENAKRPNMPEGVTLNDLGAGGP